MTGMEFWFHHVGVSVADLEGSVAWYEQVLDFRLERRVRLESVPADVAVLRNGPLHIELLRVDDATPGSRRATPDEDLRTLGTRHVSFSVDDVLALVEALRARGAEIVWVKAQAGGRASSFIRDFEGNLIEFVQHERVLADSARIHPAQAPQEAP